MTPPRLSIALLLVAAAVFGCASNFQVTLPSPISPSPGCSPFSGAFLAGFGRADITPPPGLGLMGYGPEGKRANGHRQRLYARALVLEDRTGERVALLVADLPLGSATLHRETAAFLPASTCLGADRIVAAVTHTHAGPGHYMTTRPINEGASSVKGYDPVVVDFLAERFAAAIEEAVSDLSPALADWSSTDIWGLTRNRSLEAFLRNDPPASLPQPPAAVDGAVLQPEHRAVDPRMTMLRIDQIIEDAAGGFDTVPAGAFTLFAMHQTGNPSGNDLFDGDIFAVAERGLERHIDDRNGRPRLDGAPNATALFALGSAGDVSPDWPDTRICPLAEPRRIRRPSGPRAAAPPTVWRAGDADAIAFCISEGRRYIEQAGQGLSHRAIELFDSMDGTLQADFTVGRAFETAPLSGPGAPEELCDEARVGTTAVGGTEDGHTRYHRWSIFGLIPSGFQEGEHAAWERPRGCHGRKRVVGGFLQGLVLGDHAFPRVAQLSVVRIGPRLLGAVPWEVTTTAGERIKRSIDAYTRPLEPDLEEPLLMTVSNGYLQYLTTEEEYALQLYEAGSNLYGPKTAEFLAERMGTLAASVLSSSPTVTVTPILTEPGSEREIFPRPDKKAPPSRAFEIADQRGDTVRVQWTDSYPGDLLPSDGPLLYIERGPTDAPQFVTWDDDPLLEVRGLRSAGTNDYLWEVTWTGCQSGTEYRFVLTPREWQSRNLVATAPLPRTSGDWFTCEHSQ